MVDLWKRPEIQALIEPTRYAVNIALAHGIADEAEMALADARRKLAENSPIALRRGAAYAHDAIQLVVQALMSVHGMKLADGGAGDHARRDEFALEVALVSAADRSALRSLRVQRNNAQYPADTSAPDLAELERWIRIVDRAIKLLFAVHFGVTRELPHRRIPPPPDKSSSPQP